MKFALLALLLTSPLLSAQNLVVVQPMAPSGGVLRSSQLWIDPSGQNDLDSDAIAWEDFQFTQDTTITHVRWWGEVGPSLGFRIRFYNQDPNTVAVQPDMFAPGSGPISSETHTTVAQTPAGGNLYQFDVTLNTPVTFAANTRYFVSVVGRTPIAWATWGWAQSYSGSNGTFWWMRGLHMYYHLGDNRAVALGFDEGPVGSAYCTPAVANSTGQPGTLSAYGSPFAANNSLTLTATHLPQNQFGYFLNSTSQGLVANPGGSLGNLCLGGTSPIGRHNAPNEIQNTGSTNTFTLTLDLTNLPSPTGPVAALAGQTWHFQAWYRDFVGGQSVSNFTGAIAAPLQ
ncbi:MAG: hypothetical protein R3E96_14830 [Planctomycetota bacterium]